VNVEEYFKFNLLPANGSHNQPLKIEAVGYGRIKVPKWEKTNLAQENPLFVGRKQYIHEVAVALEENQCVVLHGMGGMGKTILAEAVGRWQHERKHYRDGTWWISVRGVASVKQARVIIVNNLENLREEEKEIAQESNREMEKILSDSQQLIILDDLDQLIENSPETLQELVDLIESLGRCSTIKILTTSRSTLPSHLKVKYEQIEVKGLKTIEAIETFKKYAPPGENWLSSDEQARMDFEEIIEFLEGYPLPVKLAASYLREQQCDIKRLKKRMWKALSGHHRKIRGKETSLTVALDLSYQVLPPQAQDMFSRLASFPGGLSEELSESVWGEDSVDDLVLLLQYSMAEKVENVSDWRVRLPEPARQYAEKKQVENPLECYGNLVLNYFYQLVSKLDNEQEEELEVIKGKLKREQLNLHSFLTWGYNHETSQKKIACSSRITAILGKESPWLIPGLDLSFSIEKA
jgi:predicted ATPase